MNLRVTNSTFESISPGDYATVDDAFRAAVASGVDIAAGEIATGTESVIIQVAVDLVGQKDAATGAVALSIARFLDEQAGG